MIAVGLRQIGHRVEADYIDHIVGTLMQRDPLTRPKAPAKSKPITDRIKTSIKQYATYHPTMSHREIGHLHGIDGGRVSEVLAGKR